MAESAVSLVIDKLVSLLTNQIDLLRGIHGEIADIRDELESMQSFLRDADARVEQEDADSGLKTWVKQVRELAYEIEDVIDDYLLHVASLQDQHGFLHKAVRLVKNIKQRQRIASQIQYLNNSVRKVKERSERYSLNSSQAGTQIGARGATWHDPRMASLFIDEAELVGIETPRNELVSKLVEGPSKNMVISVVGIGGLGKTTLAKKVFDHQEVFRSFDCRAWITVSQSYKMEDLLKTMLREFQASRKEPPIDGIETMKEQHVIGNLRDYLWDKRYVVVFDDVWEIDFWGCIKHVLVDKEKGSRIIITTRNENVAPSPNESSLYDVYKLQHLPPDKALELFYKKVGHPPQELQNLSHAIVERCRGLPLAIVMIGGLLATEEKSLREWKKLYNSLASTLANNPSITRILSLSYQDLPCYLKPCFLFLGIFPEDYLISRGRLLRLWIAEGLVKERQGITQEDVADEYLQELIRRSLVQVARVGLNGRVKRCQVHDLIREIIRSRSRELSFHHVSIANCRNLTRIGLGRHLAVHNEVNNASKSTTNSNTRSVLLFCKDELPKSLISQFCSNFKLLKVLDFEGAPLNYIAGEISNLLHLNYLSLRKTNVKTLPKSLGKLCNLETLDLRGCSVYDIQIEINRLIKLCYLMGYSGNFDDGIKVDSFHGLKIHGSIGCLQALQQLYDIEVDHDRGLLKDLKRLTQLRKLGIHKLKTEDGLLLCSALEKMSNLYTLDVCSINEEEFLDLNSLSHPPPHLLSLELAGPLSDLPHWISKLKNVAKIHLCFSRLGNDAMEVLQGLPNLQTLLLHEGYNGEQLRFKTGCLQKLKELFLFSLTRLKRVIIEEGAFPSLEEFNLGTVPQLEELPSGIESLKNLKHLKFMDLQRQFAIGVLPGGQDYWKISHVPAVFFLYNTKGLDYANYKLGDSALLKHLENEAQDSTEHP